MGEGLGAKTILRLTIFPNAALSLTVEFLEMTTSSDAVAIVESKSVVLAIPNNTAISLSSEKHSREWNIV